MTTPFTNAVKELIKMIPEGKVCTYGTIAALAGNPRGARQVVRILHAFSAKERLPWHRVVNRHGKISLKPHQGYELQKQMLIGESVEFDRSGTISLDLFLWLPD